MSTEAIKYNGHATWPKYQRGMPANGWNDENDGERVERGKC